MNPKTETVNLGVCYVDAGLIWIGDPCYIMGDEASSRVTDWSDFCGLLHSGSTPEKEEWWRKKQDYDSYRSWVESGVDLPDNADFVFPVKEDPGPPPTPRPDQLRGMVSSAPLGDGIGIAVSSGFGDGAYPVTAVISDEGSWGKRVKSVTITFISDEDCE